MKGGSLVRRHLDSVYSNIFLFTTWDFFLQNALASGSYIYFAYFMVRTMYESLLRCKATDSSLNNSGNVLESVIICIVLVYYWLRVLVILAETSLSKGNVPIDTDSPYRGTVQAVGKYNTDCELMS